MVRVGFLNATSIPGQGHQGGVHGILSQRAGGIDAPSQADDFNGPIDVLDLVAYNVGHEQPHGIGPDIDRSHPHRGSTHPGLRSTPDAVSTTQGCEQSSGSTQGAVTDPTGFSFPAA